MRALNHGFPYRCGADPIRRGRYIHYGSMVAGVRERGPTQSTCGVEASIAAQRIRRRMLKAAAKRRDPITGFCRKEGR